MSGDGTVVKLFAHERVVAGGIEAIHGRAQHAQPIPKRACDKQLSAALRPLAAGRRCESGMRQSANARDEVMDARIESLP